MPQTLNKNWWLLGLYGILNAIISAIYLVMQRTDGPVLFHTWGRTIVFEGQLAIAAGVCAMAAGIWRAGTGKSWALALNGLALAVLGVIQYGFTHLRISIITFAFLIIVMAISSAVVELRMAQRFRRERYYVDSWFFGLAGALSVAFVLPSVALAQYWIPISRGSHLDLLWLGSYFGFTAICTMALAVRCYRQHAASI